MRLLFPPPSRVVAMFLVLQVQAGRAFIRAVHSHDSPSLDFRALPALFGPLLPTEGLTGSLVEASPANACLPIEGPPNASSAFIVLIRRYNCSFTTKVLHAQQAGFHAAIIYNVDSQTLVSMVREPDTVHHIRIPAVFTTDVASRILKRLHGAGKLNSVVLMPEYFHFTWKVASGTTRISSSHPCRCHIQLPGPCSQLSLLHTFWFFCIPVSALIAALLIEKYLLRCHRWKAGRSFHLQGNRGELLTFSFPSSRYQECAICLEKYVERDSLKVLSCSHAFHSKCIDLWHITQARSKTCPLCMQRVMVVTRLQAVRLWKEGAARDSRRTLWPSKARTAVDQPACLLLPQQLPSRF
uniref:E3 ubiquitin-protein ligase ZNRF4-like n=1 Tax=Podarcis muralis TaxID=64176 RepID=UPI00109F6402|nr:E3 ubiquitin-protein ligase ZNRF4-like [Podarcis muralis]